MSPVSLSEPCLLVWEQGGFPRGSQERLLPCREAATPATYPNSCGPIPWLNVKRRGQLSQRLWAISAIPLDKR